MLDWWSKYFASIDTMKEVRPQAWAGEPRKNRATGADPKSTSSPPSQLLTHPPPEPVLALH